jgi:hypothetical protein
MEILKPDMKHLRNEEHYQLGGEFNGMVVVATPVALNIEPQFNVWTGCFRVEGLALKKITKSAYTGYISEASAKRDGIFRGMADTNRGMMKHFDTKWKDAASQLQIVFDTYGNIAGKPLTEKTGAYENLIEELRGGAYLLAVKQLMLERWVTELESSNKEVFRLTQERNNELAGKIIINVKEARRHTDDAYDKIMQRIGALLLIEGEGDAEKKELYESFIRKHNASVARYNNAIAARRGRASESADAAAEIDTTDAAHTDIDE